MVTRQLVTPPQWPSWGQTLWMGLSGYPHPLVSPSFPLDALSFSSGGSTRKAVGDVGTQTPAVFLARTPVPALSIWAPHILLGRAQPGQVHAPLWVTPVRSLLGQTCPEPFQPGALVLGTVARAVHICAVTKGRS